MTRTTQVESSVDTDVAPKTAAPEPLAWEASEAPSGAAPVDTVVDPHTPIWNELADDWARVQAVLAEEVPADAPA